MILVEMVLSRLCILRLQLDVTSLCLHIDTLPYYTFYKF